MGNGRVEFEAALRRDRVFCAGEREGIAFAEESHLPPFVYCVVIVVHTWVIAARRGRIGW